MNSKRKRAIFIFFSTKNAKKKWNVIFIDIISLLDGTWYISLMRPKCIHSTFKQWLHCIAKQGDAINTSQIKVFNFSDLNLLEIYNLKFYKQFYWLLWGFLEIKELSSPVSLQSNRRMCPELGFSLTCWKGKMGKYFVRNVNSTDPC